MTTAEIIEAQEEIIAIQNKAIIRRADGRISKRVIITLRFYLSVP